MAVIDDLVAEQDRLETILAGLGEGEWAAPSAAAGWSVADVVLHLAQTEEAVVASAAGRDMAVPSALAPGSAGPTLDEVMNQLVEAQRAAPAPVFQRWRDARAAAAAALRAADPQVPLTWVDRPLKPATLATTRLAEHWAHGLDITGPLGLDFPDTARLRHIAWLAHRSLPYALALAGEPPHEVFCDLTAPDGADVWRFGPPDADTAITGPAGAFCRVAAQRLTPAQSGLRATGPHGAAALRVLRTYAA
ncbi:MAG TPA: maleylpyruvate isomerase family mycothiol-dependent enzyme [Streptosporangiaceae bacterium]